MSHCMTHSHFTSLFAFLFPRFLHYIDVIMTTMASQITSLTVVYSTVIQTQIKENIKAPRHWPLYGEFTGTGEFPAQMASNAENVSIWWRHHVYMLISASLFSGMCPYVLIVYPPKINCEQVDIWINIHIQYLLEYDKNQTGYVSNYFWPFNCYKQRCKQWDFRVSSFQNLNRKEMLFDYPHSDLS